jgi:hypothetical protein
MNLHAKLDLWNRDEHGSYAAELNNWSLLVKWRPESSERRRGFWFEAKSPDGTETSSDIFEEIEIAMAHAEQLAGHDATSPSHDRKSL